MESETPNELTQADLDTLELAAQNDGFRTADVKWRGLEGKRLNSEAIDAFDQNLILDIWRCVRTFNDFNAKDDPWGEHDFGRFEHPVVGLVFWKIDYYNLDYSGPSPDPFDADQTARVLNVMLASEVEDLKRT